MNKYIYHFLARFARILLLLLILLPVSCKNRNENGIVTCRLTRRDYSEKVNITGSVQAVVNHPVIPPRSMFGQMTVKRLADDGEYVRRGDTICVLVVQELESMYERNKTSIENLQAEISKKEADYRMNVALLEAQLATSEAQLRISSLDSLKLSFVTGSQRRLIELEMKKAVIEKSKTEKKLSATRQISETDIRQAKMRLMQETARLKSMEDQIRAMTIIAQRDGIVTRTESPKFFIMSSQGIGEMGGPIKEGSVLFLDTPVLQFPDMSLMQVSAEVAETDFRKIEKGQPVKITIDAAQKLATTGKVNRKTLIGKANMRYSESKVKFYEVIIDIDSCHSRMKPGLTASCEVTISEAKDTVFVPSLAIFEKDSSSVVYVLERGYFMPVKIKAGSSGSSHTIITTGLKGDEVIALSEPPPNLVRSPKTDKYKEDSIINLKAKQP